MKVKFSIFPIACHHINSCKICGKSTRFGKAKVRIAKNELRLSLIAHLMARQLSDIHDADEGKKQVPASPNTMEFYTYSHLEATTSARSTTRWL